MEKGPSEGSIDIRRAALNVARICDQHGHQENCTDLNHRRDVHYIRECLQMLGILDGHNRLVDIVS